MGCLWVLPLLHMHQMGTRWDEMAWAQLVAQWHPMTCCLFDLPPPILMALVLFVGLVDVALEHSCCPFAHPLGTSALHRLGSEASQELPKMDLRWVGRVEEACHDRGHVPPPDLLHPDVSRDCCLPLSWTYP